MEIESLLIGLLAGILIAQNITKKFTMQILRKTQKEEDTQEIKFDK